MNILETSKLLCTDDLIFLVSQNSLHFNTKLSRGIYGGKKFIQLIITKIDQDPKLDWIIVLRKVENSFINVSQLFKILIKLNQCNNEQIEVYFKNEFFTNSRYTDGFKELSYNFQTGDKNPELEGLWVSYDIAIDLALKFDLYDLTKKLFLVDVHDINKLELINKNFYLIDKIEEHFIKSLVLEDFENDFLFHNYQLKENEFSEEKKKDYVSNYNLSRDTNNDYLYLINIYKSLIQKIFRLNLPGHEMTLFDVQKILHKVLKNNNVSLFLDVKLDDNHQTALHLASASGSLNLIIIFLKLGLNSVNVEDIKGESPLIYAIKNSASKQKGVFYEIVFDWLFPNIWLFDKSQKSFLHHLIIQLVERENDSIFYAEIIFDYLANNEKSLNQFMNLVLNSQDDQGNTCLHIAAKLNQFFFVKLCLIFEADVNIVNKKGVKSIDFEIVSELLESKNIKSDYYIFDLIGTKLDFLKKRSETGTEIPEITREQDFDVINEVSNKYNNSCLKDDDIFDSILCLLFQTKEEYESALKKKKKKIANCNNSLHAISQITANNRYTFKKIAVKLEQLEKLKLQLQIVNEKIAKLIQTHGDFGLKEDSEQYEKYQEDNTYIIEPIFTKLLEGTSVKDQRLNKDLLNNLPSVAILKAQINIFKNLNNKIIDDMRNLTNYVNLTTKFKKVVSICTNVNINEVDGILDDLLYVVETQK